MLIADSALSPSASEMHSESTIGATCPKRRAMIVLDSLKLPTLFELILLL